MCYAVLVFRGIMYACAVGRLDMTWVTTDLAGVLLRVMKWWEILQRPRSGDPVYVMSMCLSGPSPARDVVVDARRHNGTSELHISWNPPLKPNGEVTHYEVYWQPQPFHAEKYHQRNYCDDSKPSAFSSPLDTLKLNTIFHIAAPGSIYLGPGCFHLIKLLIFTDWHAVSTCKVVALILILTASM